jgi:hypothetical protein
MSGGPILGTSEFLRPANSFRQSNSHGDNTSQVLYSFSYLHLRLGAGDRDVG